MKKSTYIFLVLFMSTTFIGLSIIQVKFFNNMANISQQEFDNGVRRSVMQTLRYIEEREALTYLANTIEENNPESHYKEHIQECFFNITNNNQASSKEFRIAIEELHQEMMDKLERKRDIMDQAVFRWMQDEDKPLKERINFEELTLVLTNVLSGNGLNLPFDFIVKNYTGDIIYNSNSNNIDFSTHSEKEYYCYTIFPFEATASQKGKLFIHFPTRTSYLRGVMYRYLPSFILMLFVLVIFIITLVIISRQKQLYMMKNDFVNNLTHELKTPISSISLASQMLQDETLQKTPHIYNNISNIIKEETRRLNLQIEKVLQMALYESHKLKLQFTDLHINALLEEITHIFQFKVDKKGGKLITDLRAEYDLALIDEVHFTNVIYNLMDNALKYSSPPLVLKISTRSTSDDKIVIEVEDNGIGITKSEQRFIFDKFYRVHTGNIYQAKGFGIGLAYVNDMVKEHHGTIQVISEFNVGTKFIISIPTLKND